MVQDYQRDSVTMIIRDSIILKDSVVLVEVPMESDKSVLFSTDTSRLETSVAKSVAFVDDQGRLNHTLQNKDALLSVKIAVPHLVHSELSKNTMVVRQTVEVEKELSKWQNFIQMLGYGFLVACVLWLISKVRRLFVA